MLYPMANIQYFILLSYKIVFEIVRQSIYKSKNVQFL